jgi:hypothetical protein
MTEKKESIIFNAVITCNKNKKRGDWAKYHKEIM